MAPSPSVNLGFLTVLHESNGYLGGYLVTNVWGRPLEFRLSTAVQPNRVQQVLYAATLEPYIYGDLIGKALVEKTSTPVQIVLTDCELALDLRRSLETPVALLAAHDDKTDRLGLVRSGEGSLGAVYCHPRIPADVPVVRELLERLDAGFDLAEPFARIREAMGEARKMGVTSRAA